MKALVYHGAQQLRVETLAQAEVGSTDVKIRILYCGVCGTDMHIYRGDGGAFAVKPPLVMGHEFSGLVEEVGAEVNGLEPGDLVSADPNDMCGACFYCQNAMEQFCTNIRGLGTTVDGGFAEFCVVPAKQVYRFKTGTDPVAAAFCEPLSCCLHGIDLCEIKLGSEVLIIGGGPIGLLMLQLVKLSGASRIIVSEPVEEKRALAKKLGADLTINPLSAGVETLLAENSKNIDFVIECVGSPRTIENALTWAGYGATVMLFGLTGADAVVSLKPDVVFKKELKVTSSFINPYSFDRAGALLEAGHINVSDLVGAVVDLKDAARIFEDDSSRTRGKILIRVHDC